MVKKIVPTANPVTAGRIEAKVLLTNTAATTGPDAQFVFAHQGLTKYRDVQFAKGKIVIGEGKCPSPAATPGKKCPGRNATLFMGAAGSPPAAPDFFSAKWSRPAPARPH